MTSHRTVGDALASLNREIRSRSPRRTFALLAGLALALNLLMFGSAAVQDNASPTAGTPAATPAANAIRLELEFDELNDSGISGTATLYEAGDQTIVDIALEGAGNDHPAHIHAGTCDELEPESSWELTNVTGGASLTLVDVSLSDLLNGEYAIDLHLAPDQLGLLIGCTDIAGTPVNAGGTPVAAGGEDGETPASEPTATEISATEVARTEAPVTVTAPTQAPISEPTATVEPTATLEPTATERSDGTGAMNTIITPAGDGTAGGKGIPLAPAPASTQIAVGTATGDGDGTAGGKGIPLAPAPTQVAVGAASSTGDGTAGDKTGVGRGKGVPIAAISNQLASTGSGDSLTLPTSPMGAAIWATGSFALVLMASGLFLRLGERQRRPNRWRRLGL